MHPPRNVLAGSGGHRAGVLSVRDARAALVGLRCGMHQLIPTHLWVRVALVRTTSPTGVRAVLKQPHLQEKQGIPACQSRFVLSISAVLPLAPIAR